MPSPDPADDAVLAAADRVAALALAEDLGEGGDVTSAACVPATATGVADVVARAAGVVAGLDVARVVFSHADDSLDVRLRVDDGRRVAPGTVLATVRGLLRPILAAERTALNLLGHLSGIATSTARYVDAVVGTDCVVRDTRKTLPGLRVLEKAAVRAGGGSNHRSGLDDALLVKDNHVAAAGGIGAATRAALDGAGGRPVQVEVVDLDGLAAAVDAGATAVLLDNFAPHEAREAVARVGGRVRLEASGGIDLDTVRAYALTGVDSVAVGALTHSAPWLDVALDVRAASGDGAGASPARRASVGAGGDG